MARKAISTEDKPEMPRRKTKAKATKRKSASSYREKAPVRRDLETEKFPADYEDALYAYVNAYLDSIKDDNGIRRKLPHSLNTRRDAAQFRSAADMRRQEL